MTSPEKHQQPSPEWIARAKLGIGLRQLFGRTVARDRPLFKGRIPDLGSNFYVEVRLLPSLELVLQVIDAESGEVHAISEPNGFTELDTNATKAAQMLRTWQAAREAAPPSATATGPEA